MGGKRFEVLRDGCVLKRCGSLSEAVRFVAELVQVLRCEPVRKRVEIVERGSERRVWVYEG